MCGLPLVFSYCILSVNVHEGSALKFRITHAAHYRMAITWYITMIVCTIGTELFVVSAYIWEY